MKELNETPRNLRAVWVPMTLTALVMALLIAAAVTASSTQADGFLPEDPTPAATPTTNTGGGNTGDYTNHSTYKDPQPCGPGAGTAFMEEPHEIQTGHYALFDAYWRTISTSTSRGPGLAATGVGVLHTNECPPEMIQTTTTEKVGFGTKTVTTTTRSARDGGMDIEEAIIHVLDDHLATTVATNAEATDGQLSLEEYPRVGEVVHAGDRVWWLQLDDPDSTSTDETSDLGMGFSTLLLDKKHWKSRMRYRFEAERHPADPIDVPHFFAYQAPKADGADQKPVWDSEKPGEGVMELDPGEYKALQWVFTEPGTYLLWVHLLGDVKDPPAGADWNRISSNETETSEVYRYTIQVGTDLDEVEPPIFGVNLEVEENSPGGVKVGDPIPIYNAEADALYYDLTGPGHSDFELVTSSDPFTVQVVVADGASLDYDDHEDETTTTTRSYELNLSVTDKVDHEDNFNPYADDVLIVKIDLKDQAPGLKLQADKTSLKVGDSVNFTARFEPTSAQSDQKTTYQWGRKLSEARYHAIAGAPNAPTWSVSQSAATTVTYVVEVLLGVSPDITSVVSNEITITWEN